MASSVPTTNGAPAKKSRWVKFVLLAAIAGAVYWWWAYESTDPAFGRFQGNVATKWITDDLEMQLVDDFHYVDPQDKRWTAPAGSVINGASIPSVFWSVIGGPFEGRFRFLEQFIELVAVGPKLARHAGCHGLRPCSFRNDSHVLKSSQAHTSLRFRTSFPRSAW